MTCAALKSLTIAEVIDGAQNTEDYALLTNVVQVEAVRIVAHQALQERVAVLGGAIACLHGFACPHQSTFAKDPQNSTDTQIKALSVISMLQKSILLLL